MEEDLRPLYGSEKEELVQCSQVSEYCFLCENVDPEGSDGPAAALRGLVAELVRKKKELPFVVNSVYAIYTTELRGEKAWSKASIKRHLLFSTEFDSLFTCVVDQLFISLIMRTQSQMVNEIGGIDEVARKALLESIGAFNTWKKKK